MKERLGIVTKVANLKNGLRVGEVVLPQVVIETCPGAAEVRDTGSCSITHNNVKYNVMILCVH